jgi:phosphatidylinositol alpha-1,6-mannosyltransferase
MRICIISYNIHPFIGGIETYSKKLNNYMFSKFGATLIKPSFIIRNKPILILETILKSWIVLYKNDFAIVHITNLNLWPISLINLIKSKKTIFVINIHGLELIYGQRKSPFSYLYKVYINKRLIKALFSSFICNSIETRQLLEKSFSLKGTFIPMGISKVRNDNPNDELLPNQIFFVGRLVKRKGILWFIENVLINFTETILYISGPINDKQLYKEIIKHKNVKYLGVLSDEEIAKFHRQSLVSVFPTVRNNDFEGFGISFIQAIANGGIVIGSNYQGTITASIRGKIGYLAYPNNSEDWIEKIRMIKRMSALERKTKIMSDQKLVKENFLWDQVFEKTVNEYINLIKNN